MTQNWKVTRRWLYGMCGALALALLLFTGVGVAQAQNYSFSVPLLRMQVYVRPDASVRIIYDITFDNRGSPIDVVDIGTPTDDYNIANMTASIDGVGLGDIRPSEYIDTGVEIHLGSQEIARGERGTLHVEFTMPDMVYQDTTNRELASLRITPTWFDEDLVQGTGLIQVAIYTPEGVHPDELLYQRTPFTNKGRDGERAIAFWEWEDEAATGPHLVGVSFPKRVMTTVVEMSLLELTNEWLRDNPEVRVILGVVALVLFALLFFRFSGGTGCTVYAFLGAGLVAIFVLSPFSVLLSFPVLAALIAFNEVRLRKRAGLRADYLPAIAQVEGGGIKRGLAAPEAAVLLELPFNKVLTLVIFGMLEKGLVEIVEADPLQVTVVEDYVAVGVGDTIKQRRTLRRNAAQRNGTVIHTYEDRFLDTLERNADKPVSKIDFSNAMEYLVKIAAAKMKGFDLSDTQDYYRRVIDRAMKQAASLGEIEEREQYLDKYLPWVMMNEDEKYRPVLTHRGYNYWPIWAGRRRRFSGGSGRSSAAPRLGGEGRPSAGGRTTFGDVAGSFAGWTESTMGGLAASILPASMNLPKASGGFVDLSGVDRVTGDVFEALSKASSSGGGGGGGGGCACACAGCACACACAGGGR